MERVSTFASSHANANSFGNANANSFVNANANTFGNAFVLHKQISRLILNTKTCCFLRENSLPPYSKEHMISEIVGQSVGKTVSKTVGKSVSEGDVPDQCKTYTRLCCIFLHLKNDADECCYTILIALTDPHHGDLNLALFC